jgi:RNA polymerase sigma-70 factor (ECF subfamily)
MKGQALSERSQRVDNGASSYRRFLNGDDRALEEIVREYKDGLILFLIGFVGDISTAEDLMQETFFRLITRRPHFRETYSFKTWLYSIARNAAIDHLRKQARRAELPYEEAAADLADEQDLEKAYLMEERKIAVHRALKALPPDYRQVLWLLFFEELTSAEAGAVMKKRARQMKNLVYRAKGALKSELEKEGFVYEERS